MTTGAVEVAPDVLIVTRRHDFHAMAMAHTLPRRGLSVAVIEIDGLAGTGHLIWTPEGRGRVRDVHGLDVLVDQAAVLWWRRLNGEPIVPEGVVPEARELVERSNRAAVLGLLETSFRGRYISPPEATRSAENKLVQLQAAREVGLRVPETLISSDPEQVRRFCRSLDWRVVCKAVGSGGARTPVMTGRMQPSLLQDAAVRLAPAIYQELVPGTRHLRVNVFGAAIHTALLTTDRLDWRHPLDAVARPYRLDSSTGERLCALLDRLHLAMGVFDLKLGPDGEPVWLELNPQGQFLWLEGLCGMPLTDAFADFLCSHVPARAS